MTIYSQQRHSFVIAEDTAYLKKIVPEQPEALANTGDYYFSQDCELSDGVEEAPLPADWTTVNDLEVDNDSSVAVTLLGLTGDTGFTIAAGGRAVFHKLSSTAPANVILYQNSGGDVNNVKVKAIGA